MTDTKELAERVREAKHYAERKDHTSAEASRIILAALSELEERLEAAERERDEMAMVLDGLGWKRIRPGQWERQEMK